ncbi:Hsp20/alpha crystallin family protein [Streptomyces sp. NPDC003233]
MDVPAAKTERSRSVSLPTGADEDDVTPEYTDGMLTVSEGLGAKKTEAKHVEIGPAVGEP